MTDTFRAFADDIATLTIGGLTIENTTDRVSLSGSLDLARDRQSLNQARALRAALDGVIATLEGQKDLPALVAVPKPAAVTKKQNPFA